MTVGVEVQITHFHQDFGAPEVPLSSSAVCHSSSRGPLGGSSSPRFIPRQAPTTPIEPRTTRYPGRPLSRNNQTSPQCS